VVVSVTQHYETRGDPYLQGGSSNPNNNGGPTKMMGRRSHSFSGIGSGNSSSSAATASQNPNRAMHAIGFAVYEVPPNVTRLTAHFEAEHVNYNRLKNIL